MRLALALCIVVSCALGGWSIAASTRRRAAALQAIIEAMKALRIQMTTMFEPLQVCLSRSECALFQQIGAGMGDGVSACDAWQTVRTRARRSGGMIDALAESDVQTLDRAFCHLGESGRASQDLLLKSCIAMLEGARDAAREKSKEADRLYITLGTLLGLMLALIVI